MLKEKSFVLCVFDEKNDKIHFNLTVQATLPTFFPLLTVDWMASVFALSVRYNDKSALLGFVTLRRRRQISQWNTIKHFVLVLKIDNSTI